jgi:general secretion pathway protein I
VIARPVAARAGRAGGFTLIEILVALAVFAVVAVTVYTRGGEVIRQTGALEERVIATWLADNEMALLRMARRAANDPLPTGSETREVVMASRRWDVTRRVADTTHPWLRRVEVEVSPVEDARTAQAPVYRLTGFVGRH